MNFKAQAVTGVLLSLLVLCTKAAKFNCTQFNGDCQSCTFATSSQSSSACEYCASNGVCHPYGTGYCSDGAPPVHQYGCACSAYRDCNNCTSRPLLNANNCGWCTISGVTSCIPDNSTCSGSNYNYVHGFCPGDELAKLATTIIIIIVVCCVVCCALLVSIPILIYCCCCRTRHHHHHHHHGGGSYTVLA
eukprot:TRINITY_DN836_c1_g1_i1.p1 TRINITY_DN836_c1_g1~~TRINITY_DN836_c1_g1_i1.p1  ORF type:complete len:190 (-),score=41.72 TRINITY_DN836_c1_g1_i1:358-927(-)